MNIFQKKIYKTHVKNNSYPAFLYWVAFALLISIFCFGCGSFLKAQRETLTTKEKMGYSHVVESTEYIAEYFSYYKLSNLVTIEKGNHIANANFYVQINSESDIRICSDNIAPGEIAISEKIAKNLNVSVGDSIQLMLPLYADASTYKVVKILSYVDDYYDFEDDYDFSVALIGYDSVIESHAKGVYVGFFTEEDVNAFLSQELPYNKMYYVTSELEQSKNEIITSNIIVLAVLTAMFSLYSILISTNLKKEWRKYFVEGVGLNFLRRLILLDKLIFIATLGLFVFALMFVASLLDIVLFDFALKVLVSYVAVMVVNLSWRDKYGKAI